MQIKIQDESPQQWSILCWRPFPLWHILPFITGFPKNSFSCSLQSFYDFFPQQIKLNYFLTKEQKKTNFENFDQILLTVTLNKEIKEIVYWTNMLLTDKILG